MISDNEDYLTHLMRNIYFYVVYRVCKYYTGLLYNICSLKTNVCLYAYKLRDQDANIIILSTMRICILVQCVLCVDCRPCMFNNKRFKVASNKANF